MVFWYVTKQVSSYKFTDGIKTQRQVLTSMFQFIVYQRLQFPPIVVHPYWIKKTIIKYRSFESTLDPCLMNYLYHPLPSCAWRRHIIYRDLCFVRFVSSFGHSRNNTGSHRRCTPNRIVSRRPRVPCHWLRWSLLPHWSSPLWSWHDVFSLS